MTTIAKRNRTHQKFNARKIARSVERAIRDSARSAGREISRGIARAVRGRKSVRSRQLRKMVLSRLKSKSTAAVSAWHRFEKRHRRR